MPRRSPKRIQFSTATIRRVSYRLGESAARAAQPAPILPLTARQPAARRMRRPNPLTLAYPISTLSPAVVTREEVALTLPVPPSINHQYATVNGRRVLSALGRSYKTAIAQHVLIALAQSPHREGLQRALKASFLTLSIRFYFASPLRRDVDSGLKIAQDALCEAFGLNDNRVLEIHLYKSRDASHPRIELSLRALPN